jgi:hypothetical protein
LNPLNSFEFNNVVGVFENSGLSDLAHKYGLEAVKRFPDSYDAWRNLSQLSKSSDLDRQRAIENMKRLDPLNTTIGLTK